MQSTSERLRETGIKSKGALVWWGVLAGLAVIAALSLLFGVRRSAKYDDAVNRGPALEAAPGKQPSRDIDRSANR